MESVLKFESPCNIITSGMSGSGKTCLFYELLKQVSGVFKDPSSSMFNCYGIWQRLYDDMKATVPIIKFVEGLPTKEMMETWAWKEPNHKVIEIDDCLQVAAKSVIMVDLFTKFHTT